MSDATVKGFKVPKIKKQESKDNLRILDLKSRDAQEISDVVSRSFLERSYKSPWELKTLHLVDNKELEESYRAKKAEMKDEGRHSRDLADQYAFLLFRDSGIMAKVIKQGLIARQMPFNALGASKFGVYLCRNADVQLRLADGKGLANCTLVVFKITLGKCKTIAQQSMTEGENIEPTPNYDCHVSQVQARPTDSLYLQLARSQVFLYEYTDECVPSERPRQCLPYAILSYEKQEKEGTETTSAYGKQTTTNTTAAAKLEHTTSDSTSNIKRTGSYGDSIDKTRAVLMGHRSNSDPNFNPQQQVETPLQANVVQTEVKPRDPRMTRMGEMRGRPVDSRLNPVDPRLSRGGQRLNIDPGDQRLRPTDPRLNTDMRQSDPRGGYFQSIPLPNFNDPRFKPLDLRPSETPQNLNPLTSLDPRLSYAGQAAFSQDPRLQPSDPRLSSYSQNSRQVDPRLKGNPNSNLLPQTSLNVYQQGSEENQISSAYKPSYGPQFGSSPLDNFFSGQNTQDNVGAQPPSKSSSSHDVPVPRDPRLRKAFLNQEINPEILSQTKSNYDTSFIDSGGEKLQRKKLSIDEYKKKVDAFVKQDESNEKLQENQYSNQTPRLSASFYDQDFYPGDKTAPDSVYTVETSASGMSQMSENQSTYNTDLMGKEDEDIYEPYSPSDENPSDQNETDSKHDDIVTTPYMMMKTLSELSEPDDASMSPEQLGESDLSCTESFESALTVAIKKLVEQSPDMTILTQAIQVLGQTHDMKDILEALKKALESSVKPDAEGIDENVAPHEVLSTEEMRQKDSPMSLAMRKTLSELDSEKEKVTTRTEKFPMDKITSNKPILGVGDIPLPDSEHQIESPTEEKGQKIKEYVKFFLDREEEENKETESDFNKDVHTLSIKESPSIGFSPNKSLLSGANDKDERLKATKHLFQTVKDGRTLTSESEPNTCLSDPSVLDRDERLPQHQNTCLSPILSLSEAAHVEDVDERKHHSRSSSPKPSLASEDVDHRKSHSRSLSPVRPLVTKTSLTKDIGERSSSPLIPFLSKSVILDVDERKSHSRSQSPVASKSAPALVATERKFPTPIRSPDPETNDSIPNELLNKNNSCFSEQEESLDVDLRQSKNENVFGDVDWRWKAASEMGDTDLRANPGQAQATDYSLPPVFEAVNDFWTKRENKEGDLEFREIYGASKSDHQKIQQSKPYESYNTSVKKIESYESSKKTIPSYSTAGSVYGEYSSSNKTEISSINISSVSNFPSFQPPVYFPPNQNLTPPQQLVPAQPAPQQQLNINNLLGSVNLDFANLKNILATVQKPAEAVPPKTILPTKHVEEEEVTSNLPAFVTGLCKESPKKDPTLTKYTGKPREWVPGRKPFFHREEQTQVKKDPNYDPTRAPQLHGPVADQNTEIPTTDIKPEKPKVEIGLDRPRDEIKLEKPKEDIKRIKSPDRCDQNFQPMKSDRNFEPNKEDKNFEHVVPKKVMKHEMTPETAEVKKEPVLQTPSVARQKEKPSADTERKESDTLRKESDALRKESEIKKLFLEDRKLSKGTTKKSSDSESSLKHPPIVGEMVKHVKGTSDENNKEAEDSESETSNDSDHREKIFSLGDTLKRMRESENKKTNERKEKCDTKKKKTSPSKQSSKKLKTSEHGELSCDTSYQQAIMESLETSDLKVKLDDSVSENDKESPKRRKHNDSMSKDIYSDINQSINLEINGTVEKSLSSVCNKTDLDDVSDNSDDERFGLVIDLGETPAKTMADKVQREETDMTKDVHLEKMSEESKQLEDTDDCLVVEMEAEKAEVVDLTVEDHDLGFEEVVNTQRQIKRIEDDSENIPLVKKIKTEKTEEDEDRERRLAEEAKLAEAFGMDADPELDENAAAQRDKLKTLGPQPRKKIVINLKSAGKKASKKEAKAAAKKDDKIDNETTSRTEKDKDDERNNDKARTELGPVRTVERLGQRNMSVPRTPSPITVLGGVPHRGQSPSPLTAVQQSSGLAVNAQTPVSLQSPLNAVPPATQPWSYSDKQQKIGSVKQGQLEVQTSGNLQTIPSLSQISSVPPPNYRSPSPVNQVASSMSVGPPRALVARTMQNLQNMIASNMVPGITVPISPIRPVTHMSLPSYQPLVGPPNLAIPPPNLNVPPPLNVPPLHLASQPPIQSVRPYTVPVSADIRQVTPLQVLHGPAGVPLSQAGGNFPGMPGPDMSNLQGPPPSLRPRMQGNLTIPVIGQTPQSQKESMLQDVLQRVRQRVPVSLISTQSTPQSVQGMPIQTIGQSGPNVRPSGPNTNITTLETRHVEVKKPKDDVLDWFSDKFDIKKEPWDNTTLIRPKEATESDYPEKTGFHESERKRMWEYHEQDEYGKKLRLTPTGDNNGDYYYESNTASDQRNDAVDMLQHQSVENLNKTKNIILKSLANLAPESDNTGEIRREPDVENSDLEEGECSEDSSVTGSPLITEHDNRRVVVQNKVGNNIQVLCAANNIQRIQTIGADRAISPKRVINVSEHPTTAGSSQRQRNLAADDWSDMLQRNPHVSDPRERRMSAYKRLDSSDSRTVTQLKATISAVEKAEASDSQDSASLLASSAALITKTKNKIMRGSQVKTLGDWLKLELEIENIQPLQKYIPYAFNTDLTSIPKGRRRKIKTKVRSVLEKEGKASSDVQQEPQADIADQPRSNIQSASSQSRVPESEDQISKQEQPKPVPHGPPLNPTYSPEVPNTQIQTELELVKKSLASIKESSRSSMIKSHFGMPQSNISVTVRKDLTQQTPEQEQQLISALQTVENEMVTMLQRTYFYGYPHRRVPKDLLLESELYSFKSPEEGVFLILMMPLSIKPYNKLKTMKKEIENLLECSSGTRSTEKEEELKNIHLQREQVLRAFTGYLNKKRITKLQDLVNKYTLVYDYFKGQPRSPSDSALKFIRTTQIDLRQHLLLAKQYLAMEEKKLEIDSAKT